MKTFTVKIGKGPDEMTFDECMTHIKRVLFWDYIDGERCDVVPLNDRRWEELAGYIRGAHEREVDALKAENAELRYKVHVLEGGNRELKILYDLFKADNDRLRELAKSAWGCVNRHVSCDTCRMTCGGCTLQSAMRELGIDVEP